MARTAMTVRTLTGVYPPAPIDIATEDTFDFANGMTFPVTGKEIVFIRNSTGGALTFTVASVADAQGRTGDVTAHSVAAAAICLIGPFSPAGWAQSGGVVNIDASGALKYTLIRTP